MPGAELGALSLDPMKHELTRDRSRRECAPKTYALGRVVIDGFRLEKEKHWKLGSRLGMGACQDKSHFSGFRKSDFGCWGPTEDALRPWFWNSGQVVEYQLGGKSRC
jgi:hypothetical protein